MHVLGLDIGGTKTAVIVGDDRGRVHNRLAFPTKPQRGFESTFDELCEQAGKAIQTAKVQNRPPEVISVSIGGPLDVEQGIILSPPNLPGWDAIPLKALLEQRLALPCHIEHDGNAGALAEWFFGAARGARHVIFLTMGTGFGGGLILNGRLYRGACDMAGEVGHVRFAHEGPVAYGKAGSWEAFCSGTGIVRLAAHLFPGRWGEDRCTVPLLADAARNGDEDARAVFATVGVYLGQGLAMLVDTLNPEVIVIGSLAVRLGDLVLAPAREVVNKEALPRAAERCRIVPAALGEQIGDVASLCAAIASHNGGDPP